MNDNIPTSRHLTDGHRVKDMQFTGRLSDAEFDEYGIIYPGMKDQTLLNSFRDIRNQLLKLAGHENFVCLVTSLSPEEETSLLSINLAAVFAFDRSRSALVVDCCSKNNIIDKLITVDDALGLIDFIELDYDDMGSMLYDCRLDRIRAIPAGRMSETRTEVLESTRMRELILELKHRYPDRFIFVNAPNMTMSSEVQVLSHISDMVLFEVSPGTVTTKLVEDSIEMIGAEKVAGVIFRDS